MKTSQIQEERNEYAQRTFRCSECNKYIGDLRFKDNNSAMGWFIKSLGSWVYYCPEHKEIVAKKLNIEVLA